MRAAKVAFWVRCISCGKRRLLRTQTYLAPRTPEALRKPAPPAPNPQLATTGQNLAAVLESLLTGKARSTIAYLENTLRREIPTLAGITLPTLDRGGAVKALEFVLASENGAAVTIPATQASDGALLLTAFLALAYGNTPDILLIEEPGLAHTLGNLGKLAPG